MKLIDEIFEDGCDQNAARQRKLCVRKNARAVLCDQVGRIALLHATENGYYLLPGGKVEDGESIIEGLQREVKEETGYDCEIGGELGMVREYQVEQSTLNESYGFRAKITGDHTRVHLVGYEEEFGFVLSWVDSLDEAIRLVSNQTVDSYLGRFSRLKELALLRAAYEHKEIPSPG